MEQIECPKCQRPSQEYEYDGPDNDVLILYCECGRHVVTKPGVWASRIRAAQLYKR